jgi:hypothetical protein
MKELVKQLVGLRVNWTFADYKEAYADVWGEMPKTLPECLEKMEEYIFNTYDKSLLEQCIHDEVVHKYSTDTVCTGNHKADHINSRVMELADDIATELALQDWGKFRKGFYIKAEDGEGETMCEEARQMWEIYYDEYVDTLYNFTNAVIEIDSTKTK